MLNLNCLFTHKIRIKLRARSGSILKFLATFGKCTKSHNRNTSNVSNVFLIDPLQYEQFIYMMNKSYFVITDSGGVQEEAPSLGKPVLVMRDTTERPEAVDAGTVKLVGTNTKAIREEAQKLLDDQTEYNRMSKAHNPYGDGKACERIVNFIKESK